ncbi:MAG: CHAT domain-containing protein [Pseudonocardiaceae bacterium]
MASERGAEALEELRIRFRHIGGNRYLVLANGPASAVDVIAWRPPFSYAERLDELFSEAFGQTAPSSSVSPIDSRLTELGRELFTALLPTPIRDCLAASKGIAEVEGCELRLRFDLPATLSDLPVEILCPPLDDKIGRALALNASLSVVRSVQVTQRTPRLPEPQDDREPLSILVVGASPPGWQTLKVSAEVAQLKKALRGFTAAEGADLEFLGAGRDSVGPPTLAELAKRVRKRGNPLAVLLIAHGETSPDQGQACVVLEDDNGSAHRVRADILAGTLGNSRRVRLVVLNLCVGAKVVSGEPLSGVAQALISNRIPAVVGMSTAVTDEAASRFTAPLFRALCNNETIDEAVQLARHQMEDIRADTRIEWCAPVLCMVDGCSRGQLFKVTSAHPDDPLRDGLEATKRVRDNPVSANLAPAAFFRRAMGDWEKVLGLAVHGQENTSDKQHQALFKRLEQEACIELAIQHIDDLCLGLASDPPKAKIALPDLLGVPTPIVNRLKVEVAQANERRLLHERYEEGLAAQRKEDWPTAVEQFEIFRTLDYRDGRQRLAYAAGRLAEDEGRWADARDAYGEVGELPNADTGRRKTYAQGRAAELDGEWSQAADAYVLLRTGYRDRDERLPYARGRSAELTADWPGVLSAFDLLKDTHLDVALRRGYANARVAEGENAWTTVIEVLAGLDAGFHDGDLGRLRSYAEARVAEEDEHWDRAAGIYQTLGTGQRDVATRWPYAAGRGAQARAQWDAAVEAYRQVPDGYLDVIDRLPYVTARHGEEAGQWEVVVGAYQAIPEYSDTAERFPYARACLAASTHDWNEVIEALAGSAQVAVDLREAAGLLGGYACGRVAEEACQWVGAAEAYRACGQFRDAPARAMYMEGRHLGDSADWTAALAAYESVAHELAEAHQAASRLRELRDALPWLDGLPRRSFAEDPATPTYLASPYQTLRAADITPSSTAQEVMDASFVLMANDLWNPEVRMAWERLRSRPERLEVDALLYRLADGPALSRAQRDLETGPPGELLSHLQSKLDPDSPLFALLSGQRDAAIAEWEGRLHKDLSASGVAHALAVAWTWYAIERGNVGQHEDAARGWERAIAYWGRVLSDDPYWASWRGQRAACYQFAVSAADLSRARHAVVDWLSDRLAEVANRSRLDGQVEHAERYGRLRLALAVEMAAGRTLAGTGGVAGDAESTTSAYGPLFVRLHPELRAPLGHLVVRLDAEEGGAGFRLRCAFSELAEATVLLEQNRPERAVEALRGLHQVAFKDLPADCGHELSAGGTGCAECAEFAERNPGHAGLSHRRTRFLRDAVDLATRAFLAKAQAALVDGRPGLDTALQHWREAIEVAANVGDSVRIKQAIVPVALGRADLLRDEHWGTRLADDRMTDAIDLVIAARQLVGNVDAGQLTAKEAELLTTRGVWRGCWCYEYDEPSFERGVDDLRHALTLNPDSLDTRDNLAHGLIYWAQSLHHQSNTAQQLGLLDEALSIVHEGLLRTPNYIPFGAVLAEVLGEFEQWCFDELTDEELDRRLRERSTVSAADGPTKAAQLIGQADREIEERPVASLLNLIAAVRSHASAAVRARLSNAVTQLSARPEWSTGC